MPKQISPEELNRQIDAYGLQQADYRRFAAALRRVLETARANSIPDAFVQAREKSLSSFAEKCVRKYETYPDAINQMTDLCGARVIVQTLEQVKAVRQFIEANFEILEKDEKGLLLGPDKFGYRDMHYIIQIKSGCNLGFTSEELAVIGKKKAEIQVRTWVQHAWADTLHDRMYKTKLHYPPEFGRTGALLAALMEEGDKSFNQLALEIDGMLANYSAYATKKDVEDEIAVHELILANEPEQGKRPATALQLARLVAAGGDYERVVAVLEPYAATTGPLGCEIVLELGYALCKVHRAAPKSPDYRRGQKHLRDAVNCCAQGDLSVVPNLRKRKSIHARALARLGWSWEAISGEESEARSCYQAALEWEPGNPYYLADVLGFEIFCTRNQEIAVSMRAVVKAAIQSCHEHVVAGIEMPYACLTAGRLSLLIGDAYGALGWYARGVRHLLNPDVLCAPGILDAEIAWLDRVYGPWKSDPYRWAKTYLCMGQAAVAGSERGCDGLDWFKRGGLSVAAPVLIVSGGAASLPDSTREKILPPLKYALRSFCGTVISGGTTIGVPGCIGDVAQQLGAEGGKQFRLVGYVTEKRRDDAPRHAAYEALDKFGADFTPELLLRGWADILASGIRPADVRLIGFWGGPLSALEYRMALGLGAQVAVIGKDQDAAASLVDDKLWLGVPNLLAMPFDTSTIRAFIVPPTMEFPANTLEEMARAFHTNYVAGSSSRLPDNMKPWGKLKETFRKANLEQARYAVAMLEACGFRVRAAEKPTIFDHNQFTPTEVERMAEMEHGRWNIERLRDGWRYGQPRDDARKIHDCIVPWNKLPDNIKPYDREAVRAFPEILAKAGLEVYRL